MAENKYKPIRAETSAANTGSLRYCISDIPIGWKLDKTDGRYDFRVVAISEDGQIVDNLSSAYLSFDESDSTLTVAPVFGQKDFCVYVFRDEEAVNLFAIKSDGSASLASILAQFEKDNRVLAQLQALQGRSLRTVDECEILPDAEFRKNKFLGFDDNGNPVCEIEMTAFEDARGEVAAAKAAAAKSAEEAGKSAETTVESAKSAASSVVASAKSAEAAASSAVSAKAQASASSASAKEAAESAKEAAAQADWSSLAAESSGLYADNAADSAKAAAASAKEAAESAKESLRIIKADSGETVEVKCRVVNGTVQFYGKVIDEK